MKPWIILAAGISISAASPPATRMYVVNCGGQVDTIDTATGARLRSVDVARYLPIKRSQSVAGATFDGCLMNQAVYVPAHAVFYSVIPDQFSDKSDGTKDYHIFGFSIPGLHPTRAAIAGTSLDAAPEIMAAPDGSVRVAEAAPTELDLRGTAVEGGVLANQILETSGDQVLLRLFEQNKFVLAVADRRHGLLSRLAKLPATTALNAHLTPGGSRVYIEEVDAASKKTGRAFIFDAANGRQVQMIVDPKIAAMSFVALTPNSKAIYRSGDRYGMIGLSGVFTSQPVARPAASDGPSLFFADR